MSRRPHGFVKERKTRKGGFGNCQSQTVAVFHIVLIPLTGNWRVISRLYQGNNFRQLVFL
jgi:hypothetical protein